MLVTILGSFLFIEDTCAGKSSPLLWASYTFPPAPGKGQRWESRAPKRGPALLPLPPPCSGSCRLVLGAAARASREEPVVAKVPQGWDKPLARRRGALKKGVVGMAQGQQGGTWAEGWAHAWCRADFLRPCASATPMAAGQCPGDSPEACGSAPERAAPGLVSVPEPSSGSWSSLTGAQLWLQAYT